MFLSDPLQLERKVWGGQRGGPLDNKAAQVIGMGPAAFLPSEVQPPSPWLGMEQQKLADEEEQNARRRKAWGDLAMSE